MYKTTITTEAFPRSTAPPRRRKPSSAPPRRSRSSTSSVQAPAVFRTAAPRCAAPPRRRAAARSGAQRHADGARVRVFVVVSYLILHNSMPKPCQLPHKTLIRVCKQKHFRQYGIKFWCAAARRATAACGSVQRPADGRELLVTSGGRLAAGSGQPAGSRYVV